MKNKLFDKVELKNITIAAITMGFIFSFRKWGYGQDFIFEVGFFNLIISTVSAGIIFLIYQCAHKIVAKQYGCRSTFRIWGIKQIGFRKNSKISNLRIFGKRFEKLNIGILLPIALSFFSNGLLKVCTIGSSEISEVKMERINKKYAYISDFDTSLMHLVGPMTLIIVSLILSGINQFEQISQMAYYLAIFSMIPFSNLDGSKVFFGSPLLYVASLAFMVLSISVIQVTGILTALIFAGIGTLMIFLMFLIKFSHLS